GPIDGVDNPAETTLAVQSGTLLTENAMSRITLRNGTADELLGLGIGERQLASVTLVVHRRRSEMRLGYPPGTCGCFDGESHEIIEVGGLLGCLHWFFRFCRRREDSPGSRSAAEGPRRV